MTPDDIGLLQWIDAVRLSPDGTRAAYVVARVDGAGNTYRRQLCVADLDDDSAPHRRLTPADAEIGAFAWSPDGATICFDRTIDGGVPTTPDTHALCTVAASVPASTDATVLAEAKEAFADIAYAPDGSHIAWVQRVPGPHYDNDDPAARPPRRIDRLGFMLDDEGFIIDRPQHLHVLDLRAEGAGPVAITDGPVDVAAPAWFPDSVALAVTVADYGVDRAERIERVTLDGTRSRITAQHGMYGHPAVSPDGTEVALLGYDGTEVYPENAHVGVVPAGGGAVEWRTGAVDRTWAPFSGTEAPCWHGRNLIAGFEDRGRVVLASVGEDGAVERVVDADQCVTAWSAIGGRTAFVASTPSRPAELFVVDGDEPRRITDVAADFVAATLPRPVEHFETAPTGVDVWVMTPPGYDPDGSHPMLLNIHGGPFTQYGHNFFDEAQLQAAAGYVVVLSNPRGGSGRERAWAQAIVAPHHPTHPGTGWGGADHDDLMEVVDATLERYSGIDPDRLGILGGSYGGYMTSWIVSHTDRFVAACSERAVNSLVDLETDSDIAGMFRNELGPFDPSDLSEYQRMSPITRVDHITTPLLIIHSDDDLRCRATQADQLFRELHIRGREVEYYRFPDEGHELSRSGSPVHRRQRAELILEFFGRHLHP